MDCSLHIIYQDLSGAKLSKHSLLVHSANRLLKIIREIILLGSVGPLQHEWGGKGAGTTPSFPSCQSSSNAVSKPNCNTQHIRSAEAEPHTSLIMDAQCLLKATPQFIIQTLANREFSLHYFSVGAGSSAVSRKQPQALPNRSTSASYEADCQCGALGKGEEDSLPSSCGVPKRPALSTSFGKNERRQHIEGGEFTYCSSLWALLPTERREVRSSSVSPAPVWSLAVMRCTAPILSCSAPALSSPGDWDKRQHLLVIPGPSPINKSVLAQVQGKGCRAMTACMHSWSAQAAELSAACCDSELAAFHSSSQSAVIVQCKNWNPVAQDSDNA